ncbi:MAG: alpha/beta fold hydrolase [Bacteroidetes bacterium]|nr:alpha/beta fold hydrolase [Bacteroidota bacterium]
MKPKRLHIAFYLFFFSVHCGAQTIDRIIDAGAYSLHFQVMPGKGIPILFESGGGDESSVWKDILAPLHKVTGAPLITYDRPGLGKSVIKNLDIPNPITAEIAGLEAGLEKLGYDRQIILVAHSFGGHYAALYAARHPDLVKGVLLVDASLNDWYTDDDVKQNVAKEAVNMERYRHESPGIYNMYSNLVVNAAIFRKTLFPPDIPIISMVSDYFKTDSTESARWKADHLQFAALPNHTGITAYGCGHYIFLDNPSLVINAIIQLYAHTLNIRESAALTKDATIYATNAANELKKEETAYRHSEDDLNTWGYSLLRRGDINKALTVFKLNVDLNPQSWNVYDSYGEALLMNGNKDMAIKMYQKSLELNSGNDNAKKILKDLLRH